MKERTQGKTQQQADLEALPCVAQVVQGEVDFSTLTGKICAELEPSLDAILMANSLHFVRDKEPVLRRLCDLLRPGGCLVIIEYNAQHGNGAVPYPLDDAALLSLAARVGLVQPEIRARVPFAFLGEMYTGVAISPTSDWR